MNGGLVIRKMNGGFLEIRKNRFRDVYSVEK